MPCVLIKQTTIRATSNRLSPSGTTGSICLERFWNIDAYAVTRRRFLHSAPPPHRYGAANGYMGDAWRSACATTRLSSPGLGTRNISRTPPRWAPSPANANRTSQPRFVTCINVRVSAPHAFSAFSFYVTYDNLAISNMGTLIRVDLRLT